MSFFYLMTLEISISFFLQNRIMDSNKNANDAWGIFCYWLFGLSYAVFFIFVILFYFCTCNPAERMEMYQERVGAIYDGINYKENSNNRLITIIFIYKRLAFTLAYLFAGEFGLLNF
jgi:hypothetical protein